MLFTGWVELNIDAKGRLAIPARYRNLLGTEETGWFTIPWPDGSLRVYPERVFEELAGLIESSLLPDQDTAELELAFFGSAERVEMDSAGRITLPRRHVALAGLPSEVVVVGSRNMLVVRDRSAWAASDEARFRSLQAMVERTEGRRRGGPG